MFSFSMFVVHAFIVPLFLNLGSHALIVSVFEIVVVVFVLIFAFVSSCVLCVCVCVSGCSMSCIYHFFLQLLESIGCVLLYGCV